LNVINIRNEKEKFPYTIKGCKDAKQWLKDIGSYHLLDRELSRDGWTIVALANRLWEKRQ
jgi:hypothetical protein